MMKSDTNKVKAGRLTGLDVLRSLAMLMIVAWHFFQQAVGTSLYPATGTGCFNYAVSELLVVCSSVCVNIFVLISSYFLVDKPFNGSRIISLWLQVVFYSAGLALIFFFLKPGSISLAGLVGSFFPVSTYAYWFFTVYFGFVCLAPFLSKIALSLSRRDYRLLLLVLIIICCTFVLIVPFGNVMGANRGSSLIWFIALFFWGGYLKRFDDGGKSPLYLRAFWISALCVLCFCVAKAFFRVHNGAPGFSLEQPAYNGWAFLLSVPLFLYFKNKSFREGLVYNILKSVAPFTFGVYLFSENIHIRTLMWKGDIPWGAYIDKVWFIPLALAVIVGVFFISVGIDYLRALLFKVLKVPEMCSRLSGRIGRIINRIM